MVKSIKPSYQKGCELPSYCSQVGCPLVKVTIEVEHDRMYSRSNLHIFVNYLIKSMQIIENYYNNLHECCSFRIISVCRGMGNNRLQRKLYIIFKCKQHIKLCNSASSFKSLKLYRKYTYKLKTQTYSTFQAIVVTPPIAQLVERRTVGETFQKSLGHWFESGSVDIFIFTNNLFQFNFLFQYLHPQLKIIFM